MIKNYYLVYNFIIIAKKVNKEKKNFYLSINQ